MAAIDIGPPVRIMLVDDHAVVREGYRRLLALEPDLHVVAEGADADSAFAGLQREAGRIHVMVLDLSLPGRSGLDLLRRVRAQWPAVKVLMFSMHDSPAMVDQCLRAGAIGFITKSSPPEELVAAVRQAAQGRMVLSTDVAAATTAPHAGGDGPPHTRLSARESDILYQLLEGASLDSIAERLHLSAKTVANYQSAIRQKLAVNSAVELVRYAQRHGLLPG